MPAAALGGTSARRASSLSARGERDINRDINRRASSLSALAAALAVAALVPRVTMVAVPAQLVMSTALFRQVQLVRLVRRVQWAAFG